VCDQHDRQQIINITLEYFENIGSTDWLLLSAKLQ
jgi:hypothetical protein